TRGVPATNYLAIFAWTACSIYCEKLDAIAESVWRKNSQFILQRRRNSYCSTLVICDSLRHFRCHAFGLPETHARATSKTQQSVNIDCEFDSRRGMNLIVSSISFLQTTGIPHEKLLPPYLTHFLQR